MFGLVARKAWAGTKAVAAGRTQANLGIQSPHLPAAVVRVGRFLFTTSGLWILAAWYTGYVNMRTTPGSGPKLIVGGPVINKNPDRPDKQPAYAGAAEIPGDNAGQAKFAPGGGTAGGFLPTGATYRPGRADAGRDGETDPGGPIIAPGNGTVIRIGSDPNGFGPDYPIVKFTSGTYSGRILYLGHTHTALPTGAQFRKDQVLSYTGKTPVGNASDGGHFEIGFADSGSPGGLGQPTPF